MQPVICAMHDSNLKGVERIAFRCALLEFKRLFKTPIIFFGSRAWSKRSEPYSSADWYISQTPMLRGNQGGEQLDGDFMIDLLKSEPWHTVNPHINVFLTSIDMTARDQGSQLNFVFGVTEGLNTVQSTARFIYLSANRRFECTKALVHHELGHIFGMAADLRRPHTEYNLGPHCTNFGCAMRQGLTVAAWANHAHDTYFSGYKEIYCPQCLAEAKRKHFN